MCRIAGWVGVVLMMAGCGVAHAANGHKQADQHARWDAVDALLPDSLIEVFREGNAGPDVCRLLSVDDSAVSCRPEDAPADVRLVFPRGAVRDVWVIESGHERHIVKWVFIGIGGGLGIAMIVVNPLAGLLIVGAVLGGIESSEAGYGMPMPPRPRRFRWKLIYQAP